MTAMRIAHTVRQLRQEQGLSQAQLITTLNTLLWIGIVFIVIAALNLGARRSSEQVRTVAIGKRNAAPHIQCEQGERADAALQD